MNSTRCYPSNFMLYNLLGNLQNTFKSSNPRSHVRNMQVLQFKQYSRSSGHQNIYLNPKGLPNLKGKNEFPTNINFNVRVNDNQNKNGEESSTSGGIFKAVGVAGGVFIALLVGREKRNWVFAASASLSSQIPKAISSKQLLDTHLANLPTYRKSEVAQHDDPNKRLWVSYGRGVFDVTDFLRQHPGGDKILMAAGGSLEGFWDLFPLHKTQHVYEILSGYRIGNLHEDDVEKKRSGDKAEAFSNDPPRNPVLMARTTKPFNGETPPHLLVNSFYTPNELFYTRNHLPVPEIDLDSYQLEVEGLKLNKNGKSFTLEDIKKLPKHEISATIQCGGNRRSDMNGWKTVNGLSWSGGAIGNAKWAGASLRDVLKLAGFCLENYEHPEKFHVQFEGLDSDPSGESYGASIPLSFLLDSNFQPIVAYEMNGETLPLDHGFPLRIVLPGIVGARSVKWLARILISDEENQSPWQQRDYKVFSPAVTLETVDYSSSPSIMDTPVTSYICSNSGEKGEGDCTVVDKDKSTDFRGYAFSGGGRQIIRVEISVDRGNTWTTATTTSDQKGGTRNWSWVLWESNVVFTKKGDHEVWVKAVDSGYNQQPENFSTIWNYRGLVSNAFHKIKVKVQ